jgi:pyruvate dehydrogenase E1 component beta subunit
MLLYSLEAAATLAAEGVDVEVLDLRTLSPLDREAIVASAEKTGRVMTVEEGCLTGGVGGEISAIVTEECFAKLKAPVRRVAGKDVPIPCVPHLEKAAIPSVEEIAETARKLMREGARK